MTAQSNSTLFPLLFVSHGSPAMAIEESAARKFLSKLGNTLPRPKAIVIFSAHFDVHDDVVVTSGENPATIHDYYGFPEALYALNYPAPGAPELAEKVVVLLSEGGIKSRLDAGQGWDHGVWIAMKLIFPKADIPIVQISINSQLGPEAHYRLGQCLRVLRGQDILIVGSGGISHNLRELFTKRPDPDRAKKVNLFTEWVCKNLQTSNIKSLLNYVDDAPYPLFNHPTPEHLLPLFCILGSAADNESIKRIHQSVESEVLALDAYLSD
ncbi:DODA-type extradiol aromatic ring-opening family dioxygenase [Psychromonas ossibalaenae]|uniref:DODA-type extradiol aromatic ring-opening family dioxygenase n=1 Tax=Psychromonas ossibalaenae TaxID=444922 RepID=UPI00036C660A|nr:class III extradiol ring-cleavage dioxygenase [Psychromonas ossibalaenae]